MRIKKDRYPIHRLKPKTDSDMQSKPSQEYINRTRQNGEQIGSIVVNTRDEILEGLDTWLVLKKLGKSHVQVIVITGNWEKLALELKGKTIKKREIYRLIAQLV